MSDGNGGLDRRRFLHGVAGGAALAAGLGSFVPAAIAAPTEGDVRAALGQMLMFGFNGKTISAKPAIRLAQWLRAGKAGGVCFVKSNVGSRAEVAALTALFREGVALTPLIAIDHEGGAVQRLRKPHGLAKLPRALEVAAKYTPEQARQLYAEAGQGMAALGFNVNLAPVADLHEAANPVIGRSGRAYGSDPAEVVRYTTAFIDGMAEAGVHCSVKHFPGHGLSVTDSHFGLPDIRKSWTEVEAEPFAQLIAANKTRMIMTGHLLLDDTPATLSRQTTTGRLREKLGFSGVILTDDLDMGAARELAPRKDRVIQSIAAGSDMLMIQNIIQPDLNLADHIADWVLEAIAAGTIDPAALIASAARIRALALPTG
jgi:beta-N-acetylhexosaminidase